jgi:hypothetical protein
VSARRRLLPLAAAAALAAAGCGGGTAAQNEQAAGNAGPGIVQNVRLADCTDWKRESVADRLTTIHALGGFYGQPIGAGSAGSPTRHGATLSEKQAYDLFQSACEQSFARGFKLYLLYGKAAGFAGVNPYAASQPQPEP